MKPKADAVIYTTANRKTLANIALSMNGQGFSPRSMSEMVRMVLEIYEAWVNRQGILPPVESTAEATEILHSMFKASLNAGNRYKKTMLQNLQEEELAEDNETQFGPIPKSVGRPGKWDDNDQQRLNSAYQKAINDPRILAILEQNRRAVEGD